MSWIRTWFGAGMLIVRLWGVIVMPTLPGPAVGVPLIRRVLPASVTLSAGQSRASRVSRKRRVERRRGRIKVLLNKGGLADGSPVTWGRPLGGAHDEPAGGGALRGMTTADA